MILSYAEMHPLLRSCFTMFSIAECSSDVSICVPLHPLKLSVRHTCSPGLVCIAIVFVVSMQVYTEFECVGAEPLGIDRQ